ncbi:MAG: hypothetical protein QNI99_08660 [Woeseiaceae bacterium]|nr:hypothetical protein [Woeseiaceae bacterium]
MPLGWKMDKDFKDIPLSESSVSHKLADIQKRCSALMTDPDQMVELSLEEPAPALDSGNPYDRG